MYCGLGDTELAPYDVNGEALEQAGAGGGGSRWDVPAPPSTSGGFVPQVPGGGTHAADMPPVITVRNGGATVTPRGGADRTWIDAPAPSNGSPVAVKNGVEVHTYPQTVQADKTKTGLALLGVLAGLALFGT